MSGTLRMFLLVVIFIYFVIVFHFMKKRIVALKYALLWLLTGIIMLVLVIFPQLLEWFVRIIGIELPVNGLFAFAISFLGMILMSLTVIVTKQSNKIKILVQQEALLEKMKRGCGIETGRGKRYEGGRSRNR